MSRGTTPTIQFECDADLSAYQRVVLTFRAGCGCESVDIEKGRITFVEGGFSVTLTQEETLRLGGGRRRKPNRERHAVRGGQRHVRLKRQHREEQRLRGLARRHRPEISERNALEDSSR